MDNISFHKCHFGAVILAVVILTFSCGENPTGHSRCTSNGELSVLFDSAYAYFEQADYRQSLVLAQECKRQAEVLRDTDMLCECISHESACYHALGVLDSAIMLAFQQIRLDSIVGDIPFLATDYSNLAAISYSAGLRNDAQTYIDRAIELEKTVPGTPKLGIRYGLASEIYNANGHFAEALVFAQKSYEFESQRGDTLLMGRRLCQMGDVQMSLHQPEEAEQSFLQAVRFLSQMGEKHSLSITYCRLGTLYLSQGKNVQAIPYLKRSISVSDQEKNNLMNANRALYEAYKTIDQQEALRYCEAFHEIKDSIYQAKSKQEMAESSAKHIGSLKDQRIQETEVRLRNIIIGIAVVGVVVIGIISLLVSLLRLRIRRNAVLKKLEKMRANFFTNITHEFRTPLTIIQGLADKHIYSEQYREHVADFQTIKRQSNELLTLVNQILDYSRISSDIGIAEWRHGDVRPLLEMIIETQQIYAEQKSVCLRTAISEQPIEMDFTPDYLQKMLRNMLSNAIKYTKTGGEVYLTAKSVSGQLVLRIADTGCGISAEEQQNIFRPFYKVDLMHNDGTSSGIGLSLVSQIIKTMGGTIRVDSRVGQGTLFTIHLPLHHEGLAEVKPYVPEVYVPEEVLPVGQATVVEPDVVAEDSRPLLLIAEDNTDLSQHLYSIFADAYRVVLAGNGQEALEKASQMVPDLVLTDLMMPRMGGNELCRSMRANPLLAHIPIIILTARDNPEDCIAGLQDGAVEYLVKPFDARALVARVDNIIRTILSQRSRYATAMENGEEETSLLCDVDKAFLERVNDIISDQMRRGSVSPESVADSLCITREHLLRKLKSITGITSAAYITRFRVNYAKSLLTNLPDLTIAEVAVKCGYDEQTHFTRAFKSVTGVTPSQFRE